jgi:hypothetical protein
VTSLHEILNTLPDKNIKDKSLPSHRMIYPPAKESYDYLLLYNYIHKKSMAGGKRHGGILSPPSADLKRIEF